METPVGLMLNASGQDQLVQLTNVIPMQMRLPVDQQLDVHGLTANAQLLAQLWQQQSFVEQMVNASGMQLLQLALMTHVNPMEQQNSAQLVPNATGTTQNAGMTNASSKTRLAVQQM
jgi:hypothetical protein